MIPQPKVTIIIPVYNVEQYLRQCLDSVVYQTIQEIQIICVNDGSPDNSLAILQEYAARDFRIEIIDKPNGGLSSARNAAYPSIKGKYVLFLDSDDWWDLDLCEKTYQKSEVTGAQMTVFFDQEEGGQSKGCMYWQIAPEDKTTVEEKITLLGYPGACFKLWRTDFLLGNKLYFPEGLVFEDNFIHWQAITLADRVSVVPEQLYHRRTNLASISRSVGKHVMDIVPIFNKIYEYLLESGYYAAYRDAFLSQRLSAWHHRYNNGIPTSMKSRYIGIIRKSLTGDDREFYRSTLRICLFYKMVEGNTTDALKYHFFEVVYWLARLFPQWLVMPLKNLLKAVLKKSR